MRAKTLAWLSDEINMLLHSIEQLQDQRGKSIVTSSAKLIADIVGEEIDTRIQAHMRRVRKSRRL